MAFARSRSLSPRESRWNVASAPEGAARALEGQFGLHPVVARLLAGRGWDSAGLEGFLSPLLRGMRNPFELADMEAGVARVVEGVRRGEKMCVYGDYDVDGVCSTALMVGALRLLGVRPRVVIPHRIRDGYGMNVPRVEEIAREGITLIITVDTGVSAVEPVRRAAELGVDVVVTDHHLAGDELPAAVAHVNPNRGDAFYEFGRLCGTGVAFKFAHALLKQAGHPESESKAFLMAQLDLVALGTIADVVPLMGENRLLAHHGLEALSRSRRPGLVALIEEAGLTDRRVNAEFVGFGLGPRLNAAGRTDDPRLAYDLLTTEDAGEARRLAKQLDHLNRERRRIEEEILTASLDEAEQAISSNESFALVVGGEGWHLGVVGIVAARLSEKYDVPAVVLAIDNGLGKGSARSIPGFDIHQALCACHGHLETYGGHAAAAGLRVRVESLPGFREALNAHAGGVLASLDRTRTVDIDAEVTPAEVDWALLAGLQRLEPFGEGNPQPVLMMRGVECLGEARVVGRNHLRARVRAGAAAFSTIGFSLGALKEVYESGPMDIAFRPKENIFNGSRNLELEILDARTARQG